MITDDPSLVQRMAELQLQGAVLVVAHDRASAEEILTSREYLLRIAQRASRWLPLPWESCINCNVLKVLGEPDDLIFLSDAGCPARVYRRAEVELLIEEVRSLLPVHDVDTEILGETPAVRLVRDQILKVARYPDVSVLVLGETGTGKELVAESVHRLGSPDGSPFVAINCAAVPEQLFESEIFGHEAGAYTGARSARRGLLEAAEAGTLFLDEVGEMPQLLQAKLLRAIETRSFRRIGSNHDLPLRARIVSATNRPPPPGDSSLRADLFYRLAGFTISLPPLRERVEDIGMLATSFLRSFSERHGTEHKALASEAIAVLERQPWPGNVRELKALVEQIAIAAPGHLIRAEDVEAAVARAPQWREPASPPMVVRRLSTRPPTRPPPFNGPRDREPRRISLRDVERDLILGAFTDAGRNLSRAAKQLGIPRSTLRDKLRRYGAI